MLHGLFYFFQVSMFDEYDMAMAMGYVFDIHTQFRQLNPLNFKTFEKKNSH